MNRTNASKIPYAWFIFFFVYIVYVTSPIMLPLDSHWSVHTSLSIIHEGNTELNEYMQEMEDDKFRALEIIKDHYYTIFPVGTSLISVPFVAVADLLFKPLIKSFPAIEIFLKQKLAQRNIHKQELQLSDVFPVVEMLIAAFYCALTAVFIFLMARMRLTMAYALLIVFIFAFCTSSWSTASRALWQHGPSMLMLSISMYLLLKKNNRQYIHYIAIPLALAFIIRPTNAIPIFFISVYIFIFYRQAVLKFLLIALPFILLYFAYNLAIYDHLFSNYSQIGRVFHLSHFSEALAGNLISPNRGLFIYSPVLILSIIGFLKFPPNKNNTFILLIFVIIMCHWLLISTFPHWFGGHSYGSRLMTDMLPLLLYPIILLFEKIASYQAKKQFIIIGMITPLLLFSFYVHYKGAYVFAVHKWNVQPTNIDNDTDRIWDWLDMQILRE